jgi:polysaccharide deacetylase family sporulation protein PdaB
VFAWTRENRRRAVIAAVFAAAVLAFVGLGLPMEEGMGPAVAQPLRSVATARRELALTFDISWGTVMPPKVLAILEREKVPATFFLSGPWAKAHPDIVQRIARDGFQIESHGQAHVNYSGLSADGVRQNLLAAESILEAVAGVKVDMVRPPNGDYDRRTLEVARALGYTVVLWDTDSLDWMNPGVERIVARVLKRAHPGDIVLLHASDTCKETDLALPAIIDGLRKAGYTFVTVDRLLQDAAPPAVPADWLDRAPAAAGGIGPRS